MLVTVCYRCRLERNNIKVDNYYLLLLIYCIFERGIVLGRGRVSRPF
jgi:hypothetical protein